MGFGKDGKGQILWDISTITLGALAANDAVSVTQGSNLLEDFRILKTEYFIGTKFADNSEGPLLIGMAAGGNTAAEIEEAIEAEPNDISDTPEIEEVMRPVWPVTIHILQSFSGTAEFSTVGKNISEGVLNPRWTMPNPSGWSWWAYNLGTLFTTGGLVEIAAKHFGVWVR